MVLIDETNITSLIRCRKVIIYGAHLIAVELYRYIDSTIKVWNFSGFAVTRKEDNPEKLENQRVRELGEYQADENVIILIAMPEKYHKEVMEYGRAKGFTLFSCIGQSKMESMKSSWILRNCKADFKKKYDLYEDLYDRSWLNIALKEKKENYDNASILRRHYKFPTLYYLNMEQVWKETESFDYLKEYERTFGRYNNLHAIMVKGQTTDENTDAAAILKLYMVFSQWDNGNMEDRELPSWVVPIQAGSVLTDLKSDEIVDESGDSISEKNRMFAEMTAAYWIWKNAGSVKYKGLCHYRRHFLLNQEEVMNLVEDGIDVILTTPRYVPGGVGRMFLEETPAKEPVFAAMLQAVKECHPEDKGLLEQYMERCLYCPNNMVIAKSEIYNAYCQWIFPVLFRMEEIDKENGYGHQRDRHIAYAAEILTSCYFSMYKDEYCIAVTDYSFYF